MIDCTKKYDIISFLSFIGFVFLIYILIEICTGNAIKITWLCCCKIINYKREKIHFVFIILSQTCILCCIMALILYINYKICI